VKKKNIGSSFDSWLREEGLYQEASETAIKRVVARQVEAAMQEKGCPKRKWQSGCAPAAPPSTGCWIRIATE